MQKYRQRRARNACTCCHQQRVRCDISRTGAPCTRCSQDGERCEIWTKDSQQVEKTTISDRITKSYRKDSTFRITSDLNNTSRCSAPGKRATIPVGTQLKAYSDEFSSHHKDSQRSGHVNFSEYSFLQLSPSSDLGEEEMQYLARKGCFRVPFPPALDSLVHMYFMHVHPYSPILNEASFWAVYRHGPSYEHTPLSLFVFQALLFACCTYVELDIVKQCGFSTKLEARSEFYKRAKLLMDLGAEDQELEKARGALLLSYQASPDNPQIGSLMLGAAIQNCTIAEKTASGSHVGMQSPLLKRVWWSIVLRDGLMSLAFRRSTQISWSDPNLRTKFLDEIDLEDEIKNSEVYDEATKRFLVELFERQCRLAVIVIEAMSAFFPQKYQCSYESIYEVTRAIQEIQDVKISLSFWERASYDLITPRTQLWPEAVMNLLHMTRAYYFTARIHSIHCEAFILESNRSIVTEKMTMQMRDSTIDLKRAVNEVHEVLAYINDAKNKETIPLSMLALMAWPLAIAAIDVNLAVTDEENLQRTQQMSCLGEIYQYLNGVADVTSFVTAGAKQILLLANTAVQGLLRSRMTSPTSSYVHQEYSPCSVQNFPGNKTQLFDWLDLFSQYPEVYLLISKSTDYALSCGRLPDQEKLPECLRSETMFSVIELQLPWLSPILKSHTMSVSQANISERCDLLGTGKGSYQSSSNARMTAEDTTLRPPEGTTGNQPDLIGDQSRGLNMSQGGLYDWYLPGSLGNCTASDFAASNVLENADPEAVDEVLGDTMLPETGDVQDHESMGPFYANLDTTDGWNIYE